MSSFEPFDDDVAFTRLRSADPAAAATPDLARIRAAVDEQRLATLTDELAKRRNGRRWFMGAAAVAAGAVIIGSGGFALGTVATGSGSSVTVGMASQTAPKTSNDMSIANDSKAGVNALTPAKAPAYDPGLGLTADRMFVASAELAPSVTKASAYSLAISASTAQQRFSALATTLGVAQGQSTLRQYYVATAPHRALVLDTSAGYSVAYVRGTSDPLNSVEHVSFRLATEVPTEVEAKAHLLMSAVGVNPANYVWSLATPGSLTIARAAPKVLATSKSVPGVDWYFAYNTDGTLASMHGSLAHVRSLGSFDLVTPAEAVARLNSTAYGFSAFSDGSNASVVPLHATAGASGYIYGGKVSTLPKPLPTTSATTKAPRGSEKIVRYSIELDTYRASNGTSVLVPTYVLTAASGATYRVVALAQTTLPTPSR